MNTLYYKLRGDDTTTYFHQATCLAHLFSKDRWKYTPYLKKEDDPRSEGDRYQYDMIEWVEYRVPEDNSELWRKYRGVLSRSSIGRYIMFKRDGSAVYRFTLDTPRRRVLFIVSLLRHMEEYRSHIQGFIDEDTGLDGDEFLAVLSASKLRWSNHGVFNPPSCMPGLFHYMDNYMKQMLEDSPPSLGATSQMGFPKQVSLSFGTENVYIDMDDTDRWLEYFQRKPEAA